MTYPLPWDPIKGPPHTTPETESLASGHLALVDKLSVTVTMGPTAMNDFCYSHR